MQLGWTTLDMAGKPADLFDPPGALPYLLLYLHSEIGDATLQSPIFTSGLRSRRLRCLAPRGGRCWWVDRICSDFDKDITPERHLIERVLPWVEAAGLASPHGIAIAGSEMGGQGAVRLAFRHPDRFAAAASLGGAFDFQDHYGRGSPLDDLYPSREHCRQDTAILQVPSGRVPPIWFACSPADPWHRGNDRLHEKLSALGVEHTAVLDASPDYGRLLPTMLEFATAALMRVSLRLA